MSLLDDEWKQYLTNDESVINSREEPSCMIPPPPECDELYISTKTKVIYLNQEVDINRIFWEIPIIEYWKPMDGVIKKQMKIINKTPEELEEYKKKLIDIPYYTENIIKQINNATSRRIKFKDERKITIGTSKKDIMNCRGKIKNAFYNCFALILRFKLNNVFKEIHVKVFNTGKMEIPGILNPTILETVKKMIVVVLQTYLNDPIEITETNENVLINSNFNCGFYINREKLHQILSKKYKIETSYDPCSYPGVKCKYYYNNENPHQQGFIDFKDRTLKMNELGENKKYTEVSFMIFRTGSCLIVGNCTEEILTHIFHFIKKILFEEYQNIVIFNNEVIVKNKKNKLRKKTITVSTEYLKKIIH